MKVLVHTDSVRLNKEQMESYQRILRYFRCRSLKVNSIQKAPGRPGWDCFWKIRKDYAAADSFDARAYEINTLGTLAKTINCQGCKTGTIVSDELRIGHYRCSNYPYCHHKPRKCPKCQIGFLYSKESVKLPYYKCSKVFSKCFKFV